jgi:DNA primase
MPTAAGRKLELRVVALPPGEDPADLVQRSGGEEMERRIAESVPFVRFRVLRALDAGDVSDAEGKDRVLDELRPVFKGLAPSVMRDELLRIVGDRLNLSQELLSSLLAQPGRAPAGGDGQPVPPEARRLATAPLGRRDHTERMFLALCIALPKLGAPALAELDLEGDLTTPATRAAAAHLREHLAAPTEGLADDDPSAALIRELSVRAARAAGASAAAFEAERLQLALARLDREIVAARSAAAGDVSELAARRGAMHEELKGALEKAMEEGERAR